MANLLALPARISDKVSPEPNSGCWLWDGALKDNGYGCVWAGGRVKAAHREVYELLLGCVSSSLTLDHLCRQRSCVNPDHLEPVTLRENLRRGESPTAINTRKTHCVHGHELSGSNLRIRASGWRGCKECDVVAKRVHRAIVGKRGGC